MNDSNEVRLKLEEAGVPAEKIDEVLHLFSEKSTERHSEDMGNPSISSDLRTRLLDENDWRKRASIAARILSESLD
jgi:hypothetical protein